MTRNLFLMACLIACAPLAAQQATPDKKPPEGSTNVRDLLVPQDGVVAKVNQEIILGNEVYKKISSELEALKVSAPDDETYTRKATELWRKTLREMIEDKVMLMAAAGEGIKVDERELDKEMEGQIKKKGSKEKMIAELQQMGLSFDDYRERVRTDMIQRELILTKLGFRQKQVTPESKMPLDSFVTPREVQKYFADHREDFHIAEKVKSRQIVIYFDATTKAEKKAEAESILRQIQEGADMALLALWYSGVRAAEGGFWDWSERANFRPEVSDALFSLPKGGLGPLIESTDAFVIVRSEDRQEAEQRGLENDEVQDEIRKIVQNQKVNENVVRVKKLLVKEAYVEPADLFEKP